MNSQQQEIEAIRKEMYDVIGDDAYLYSRFASVTQKLWILAHRKDAPNKTVESDSATSPCYICGDDPEKKRFCSRCRD